MKIPIRNSSGARLGIRLEPWCDEVELAPEQVAEFSFDPDEGADQFLIVVEAQNFISLYGPASATIKLSS